MVFDINRSDLIMIFVENSGIKDDFGLNKKHPKHMYSVTFSESKKKQETNMQLVK